MITLYGIKNCDTVKKARRALEAQHTEYAFHDFRADGLVKADITRWLKNTDWETLLNQRSTSWRKLSDDQKSNINESKAIALMLENPTLIKRPILESSADILVGFKEGNYKNII